MINYLIFLFFQPRIGNLPNPFEAYKFGLWISISVELILVWLAYWVATVIVSKKELPKKLKFVMMPIFYILYYPSVWGCFWIEDLHLAIAASIGALLLINGLILIIAEKIKFK